MRLIDADKLLQPGYTDMFDEPITFAAISKEAVDHAPTVEAIPVEWLRERASRMLDFGEGVERIIQEWQDEQSK